MSKIEEIDPRVKAYLYDIGYHRWSRVHATVNRAWTMTSNIADSLNDVTKYARELLTVELLKYMRTLLERWTKEKLIKTNGEGFNSYIHTVLDGARRYIVCLENKGYSCGQFQLDELPCSHALAALRYMDEFFEQYCSPY
ncbi:uncharacterized protein LOC142170304 [Nicotiana tabacum]|uniref:Uncharacterized protein LOC142170304 n=1 Tax=Nicotiana tabacum TaxID=4097 RepID=A0AC58STI8_TOBAC